MKQGLHIKTIEEILERLKDGNGYIDKKRFQLEIAGLKEEKVNTALLPRFNNKDDLIGYIDTYRRKIKKSDINSSLTKKKIRYFDSLDNKLKQKFTYKDIDFLAFSNGYWEELRTPYGKIIPDNFVASASELMEILHISKPTMARLNKTCKLKVWVKCKVRIGTCLETEYNSKDGWMSFYSLNKIYAYLNGELRDYEVDMFFY